MSILLLFSYLLTFNLHARPTFKWHTFANSLEGPSHYIGRIEKGRVKSFGQKYPLLVEKFLERELFKKISTVCVFEILGDTQKIFEQFDISFQKESKTFFKYLRYIDFLDNTSLRIILKNLIVFNDTFFGTAPEKNRRYWKIPKDLTSKLKEFEFSWQQRNAHDIRDITCPDQSFKAFHTRNNYLFDPNHFLDQIYSAKAQGMIGNQAFRYLRSAINIHLHGEKFTLQEYGENLRSLDRKFPRRREGGQTTFVSNLLDDRDVSLREDLYLKYSSEQIIALKELVEKMVHRASASRVNIVYYDEDNEISEVIEPGVMFEYYLLGALVRKEIDFLKTRNTEFKGVAVTFADILASGIETGLVDAEGVEILYKIEDQWKVVVTTAETILDYTRKYGVIALVALPPGYEVVRIFALIALETASEIFVPKKDEDRDFSLFK